MALQLETARFDDKTIETLLKEATQVVKHAYCPYSGFAVGAAVLSAGGRIYTGCNVENASLGLTTCAERNAVFKMVAAGERKAELILIYTPTPSPTAPCGACRQVLREFGTGILVVSRCNAQAELRSSIEQLLPDSFGPENLGR